MWSPEAGPVVTARWLARFRWAVAAGAAATLAVARVRDQGAGMAVGTLQRAGEPFFTTKPAGVGFGLGLFLARTFAERWGGTLTLSSSPGDGTVATLRLPVAAPQATA